MQIQTIERRYEQSKAPGLGSSMTSDKNEAIVQQRRDMS